ncbi:MAG: alpha/beta hydrolase [Clostridia bacterium]|nr:alpha/beta hydrolase [Clostridia bacterium]
MTVAGKSVTVYPSRAPGAPLVILNAGEEDDRDVLDAVGSLTRVDYSLACIGGLDWNGELSPWTAPAVYRGDVPFAGRADEYLRQLTEEIIPAVERELGAPPAYRALAGYSLAGLFAVYSAYRTDAFSRIASASGSFWFPGFCDFARDTRPARCPDKLYLSLGDRESRTRNPVLSAVHENTALILRRFEGLGVRSVFEENPGNHFQDAPLRMAKGIAWILAE